MILSFSRIASLGITTIALATLVGCAALPKETTLPERRIEVGNGPEDLILDDHGPEKRILISASNRRCAEPCPNGDIQSYTPSSGKVLTLTRSGEPSGMVFRPHGIDLVMRDDSLLLFAISHDNPKQHHFIAVYEVEGDQLRWLRNIESPHFRSPNAVAAFPDGTVYVSNDHWKHGSLMESILAQQKATLVRVDPKGEVTVMEDAVAYGNGIAWQAGALYRAATTGNEVYAYTMEGGSLGPRKVIAKLKGPDNLRFDGEHLLVACHLRSLKFVKHAKHPEKISPTAVYRIHPDGRAAELLYFDDGDRISAGSTGLVVDGKLYISQVFEPWIIEVDLGKQE